MKVIGILDTHWGDSGKGMVVDYLLSGPYKGMAKINARFNGGNNAGHTVVKNGRKTILHSLPSSILCEDVFSLIAPMCVVNVETLLREEMPTVAELGVDFSTLKIAREAFVIMPWHILMEEMEEEALGKTKRDTTGRGIGPAYRDIIGRYGITIGDLLNKDTLRKKVEENLAVKSLIPRLVKYLESASEITRIFLDFGEQLRPYIIELDDFLKDTLRRDDILMLEGAQGTGLDINSPSYPYVTSSGCTMHDAAKIFRLSPDEWSCRIGVCKAYTTSVGFRHFPTRHAGSTGERLRKIGKEYGATTGRPRDCGWLDIVMLRHAVEINQLTHLFVTKLDVLDEEREIQICIRYSRNGSLLDYPPRLDLSNCQPIYESQEGWNETTRGVTHFGELPWNAQVYLHRIVYWANTPLIGVSTGPDVKETIWLG